MNGFDMILNFALLMNWWHQVNRLVVSSAWKPCKYFCIQIPFIWIWIWICAVTSLAGHRTRDDVTLCFDSIEISSDENTMIVTYDNANLSPRGLAAIIAKRHMSGIDARSLISLEEPSVETSHQSNAADKESPSTKIKNRLNAVHTTNAIIKTSSSSAARNKSYACKSWNGRLWITW